MPDIRLIPKAVEPFERERELIRGYSECSLLEHSEVQTVRLRQKVSQTVCPGYLTARGGKGKRLFRVALCSAGKVVDS